MQQNNKENFEELIQRERLLFTFNGGTEAQFYKGEFYTTIYSDYKSKKIMLIGEGLVFVSLISLGFWRIRKTFKEEISLTRQQNNFLLSITHELKSPLASLKLSMQTLQKRHLETAQIQRLASISIDDVDRLESLVENILLASKIESSNFQLEKNLMDLSEISDSIFTRIGDKFRDKRIFKKSIDSNIYIHADRLSFSSVIYNLIENAIKYSQENAIIEVTLKGNDHFAVLTVSDTGIGIAEKEVQKIFERFYRIGREETRTTKGTGLGLFIVKQIVNIHNGSIQVKRNNPHGSIFEVRIPIK